MLDGYYVSYKDKELLRAWLSPQQFSDLTEKGWFHVKGSARGSYEIGPERFRLLYLKGWFGKALWTSHCVQLRSGTIVDRLVGLKVMLENDERGVRASAKKW